MSATRSAPAAGRAFGEVGAARFDNIDLLRAFAALAVVTYHVIEHGKWSAFPVTGPLVTFRIGWIGVDLFFVISGFVVSYSALALLRRDSRSFARNYWLRRLTRILPLYLLTIAAWVLADFHAFFGQPARSWGFQLLSHVFFVHTFWQETHSAIDGVNWTLGVEMHFYLAVALLIRWIERTPGWRIWLYGIAVSLAWRAAMFLLYADEGVWPLFTHVSQLPGALDEFAAGIFLAKLVLERPTPRPGEAWMWLAAACATGYLAMSWYWDHAVYWNDARAVIFWRTPLAAFLVCVVAAAVRLPQAIASRGLRPLAYLGEISYGIYLWHLFAVQYLIHVRALEGATALLAVVALTVALATVSWHALEKPVMALARRDRVTPWRRPDPAPDTSACPKSS